MIPRMQTQTKSAPQSKCTSLRSDVIQRKCACGHHTIASAECQECKEKSRMTLQRRATGRYEPAAVSPIVHEVLRSPGQPLDTATRAFMESRLGYDFSRVRVHTDAKAAESAQAVSALAYTVGSEVVFGERAYLPSSPEGRHLLAHELVHVAQQSRFAGSSADVMNVTEPEHATEREADEIAQRILNSTLVPMRPTASPLRLSRDEKPKSSTCVPPTSIALGTQHVLAPSNHPEDFTYGGICSVMKVSPAVADLCPGITEDVSSGTAGCPKSLMNADACKGNSTFKVGQVSRVCDVRPGSSEFVDRHSIKPEVESILDDPNRNPKHLNRCSYTCNQRYFMKSGKADSDLGKFKIQYTLTKNKRDGKDATTATVEKSRLD